MLERAGWVVQGARHRGAGSWTWWSTISLEKHRPAEGWGGGTLTYIMSCRPTRGYKERPCLKNTRINRNKFEEVKGMFLKTLQDDKDGRDKGWTVTFGD